MEAVTERARFDLEALTLREVNEYLHKMGEGGLSGSAAGSHDDRLPAQDVDIVNPFGCHSVACGLDAPITVDIYGHVGYYCAGMNKQATVTIHGNAGKGVAENMMTGMVRVKGNASDCAGASSHGGLLIVEGSAASRCGISLKGGDIVIGGNVGHNSGFMAQAGRMVICGDAAAGLGDSLYETVIYVRGAIAGLGADAQIEPMSDADLDALQQLLDAADLDHAPASFKRVASARTLYHWNGGNAASYG